MINEPDFNRSSSSDPDEEGDSNAEPNDFFAPRPNLGRGFDAYTPSPPAPVQYPQPSAYDEPTRDRLSGGLIRGGLINRSVSRTNATGQALTSPVPAAAPKRTGFARFLPWKKSPPVETPSGPPRNPFPFAPVNGQPSPFSTVSRSHTFKPSAAALPWPGFLAF